MAQTQRRLPNNAPTSAETAALNAGAIDNMAKARRARKPVPAAEQALAVQIETHRESRKAFASDTDQYKALTDQIKTLSDQLGEMRFVRIVQPRVSKVLQALDLVGNLASGNYKVEPADIDEVFYAIGLKVQGVKALFSSATKSKSQFTLTRSRG